MADRPILFSAPMIRALLAGTKTQTRRAIPQAMQDAYDNYDDWCSNVSAGVPTSRQWEREFFLERVRIQPGDRLWVRESGHLLREAYDHDPQLREDLWRDAGFQHSADGSIAPARDYDPPLAEWIDDCARIVRPSIHMPRWASRLTLCVTDVRVERLQDISEEDARAEGVVQRPDGWFTVVDTSRGLTGAATHAVGAYAMLWETINGTGAWDANPWVAAYTFAVRSGNIDTLPATLEEDR